MNKETLNIGILFFFFFSFLPCSWSQTTIHCNLLDTRVHFRQKFVSRIVWLSSPHHINEIILSSFKGPHDTLLLVTTFFRVAFHIWLYDYSGTLSVLDGINHNTGSSHLFFLNTVSIVLNTAPGTW